MIKRIIENKLAVFFAFLVFIVIYLYYSVADPILLRYDDDWRYFGIFESHPIPLVGWWNVTRLLPEHLMPLIGYISSFLVYPLTGDYLVAASITLAIVKAIFLMILFLVIYRLFTTLCENKNLNAMLSILTMMIFFAIFKDNPADNEHMFYSSQYTLYFYYVFPNILNSIIILELLRQIYIRDSLLATPPGLTKGWLFVGIYFGIFSMLYAAGILFTFSAAVLVWRFYPAFREKGKFLTKLKKFNLDFFKNYLIAAIIFFGTIIAIPLELSSGRSKEPLDKTYFGSVFSMEFAGRIGESVYNVFLLVRSINNYVFGLMFLITTAAFIVCYKKKDFMTNKVIRLALLCLASAVINFVFIVLVAAKSGPYYISETRCAYGVFYFMILFISFLLVHILTELKQLVICVPLIVVLIFCVMINSSYPYKMSSTDKDKALVNTFIPLFIQADDEGATSIDLYVPFNSPEKWGVDCLSETLYNHKITKNKIIINNYLICPDDNVYYILSE
ncbi:MAG: hypothetical protein FWC09_01570 [Lachnospiraceae bacterium]|nr:hypothetical protein [Lachnospiraceae bacterium]